MRAWTPPAVLQFAAALFAAVARGRNAPVAAPAQSAPDELSACEVKARRSRGSKHRALRPRPRSQPRPRLRRQLRLHRRAERRVTAPHGALLAAALAALLPPPLEAQPAAAQPVATTSSSAPGGSAVTTTPVIASALSSPWEGKSPYQSEPLRSAVSPLLAKVGTGPAEVSGPESPLDAAVSAALGFFRWCCADETGAAIGQQLELPVAAVRALVADVPVSRELRSGLYRGSNGALRLTFVKTLDDSDGAVSRLLTERLGWPEADGVAGATSGGCSRDRQDRRVPLFSVSPVVEPFLALELPAAGAWILTCLAVQRLSQALAAAGPAAAPAGALILPAANRVVARTRCNAHAEEVISAIGADGDARHGGLLATCGFGGFVAGAHLVNLGNVTAAEAAGAVKDQASLRPVACASASDVARMLAAFAALVANSDYEFEPRDSPEPALYIPHSWLVGLEDTVPADELDDEKWKHAAQQGKMAFFPDEDDFYARKVAIFADAALTQQLSSTEVLRHLPETLWLRFAENVEIPKHLRPEPARTAAAAAAAAATAAATSAAAASANGVYIVTLAGRIFSAYEEGDRLLAVKYK